MYTRIKIYEENTSVVGAALGKLKDKVRWVTQRIPSNEYSVTDVVRIGEVGTDRIIGVQCEVILWCENASEIEMLFWLNH